MSSSGAAQIGLSTEAPDSAGVYRVWPGDGVAPGSESWTWHESTMPLPYWLAAHGMLPAG